MLQNETHTSMRHDNGEDIAAVVLAAGRSERMGRAKAFLPLRGGETFLSRIIRTLDRARVSPVIVVGSPEWSDIPWKPSVPAVRLVLNPARDRGQFSSLQCGLAAVSPATTAVLITLVDVPFVTVDTVDALIRALRETGADVVRPERAQQHGHPIIVKRTVVDALLAADWSQTARAVLRRFEASTVDVPIQDDGPFLDIDTADEYERVIAATTINHERSSGRPNRRVTNRGATPKIPTR
jgi:molybdenum cofactor cytidylyltransferase